MKPTDQPKTENPQPNSNNTPLWTIMHTFLTSLRNPSPLMNIVGPNQSGKTLLIKDFLAEILRSNFTGKIYYCDTEAKFPLRTYQELLPKSQLLHIVYKAIPNAKLLTNILQMMGQGIIKVQPGDIIIIDSVSEPLKRQLCVAESAVEFKHEAVEFYQQILTRITQLITQWRVRVILTHHMSYQPVYGSNQPFQQNMMEQIAGLWIYLSRNHNLIADNTFHDSYGMTILHNHEQIAEFPYTIEKGTIQLLKPSLEPPQEIDQEEEDQAPIPPAEEEEEEENPSYSKSEEQEELEADDE